MKSLYMQFNVPELMARDITLDLGVNSILISENGHIYCYTGVLSIDNQHFSIHASPSIYKGKKSKDIEKQIRGFFRIAGGCVLLDKYVDDTFHLEQKYKIIKCYVRFPTAAKTSFGVFDCNSDKEEIVEFTRAVFGLTYKELDELLLVYSKVFGLYNDYSRYPRITRSTQGDNFCDLTNLWIPKEFPYITFAESIYDFSHLSLWGFYRHLHLLFQNKNNSPLAKLFIQEGLDSKIVDILLNINSSEGLPNRVNRLFVCGY